MSDFNAIEEVVEELQAGRMIVLVDERATDIDGVELVGEGELVMIAEHADAEAVNFMTRQGGSSLYVAAEPKHIESLGIDMIHPVQHGPRGASVLASVNAIDIRGTGVSAQDRATTITKLANRNRKKRISFSRVMSLLCKRNPAAFCVEQVTQKDRWTWQEWPIVVQSP